MTSRWTRAIAIASIIGVLVGVIAAVAIPTAESTPSDPPFVGLTGPVTMGAALRPEEGQVYLRPHRGTVREELRRKDPAGGPDWVIRSMTADRMAPRGSRRPGSDGVTGTGPCLQLLREVDGKLGWIDGDNVFRPVRVRDTGLLTKCSTPNLDTRKERVQDFDSEVLLAAPTSREPRVRGQFAWGFVGPRVRTMRLRSGGETRTPKRSARWGAFLEFYGPARPAGNTSLRLRYADGKLVDTSRGVHNPIAPEGYRPSPGDAIDRASSRIIARAPDPGGGPSWGVLGTRTRKGLWCLGQAGHLIGSIVGTIDPRYGTMMGASADDNPNGCGPRAQPTNRYPVQAVSSSGAYTDIAGLAPNGDQLRLQRGRTLILGRTLDSVVRLTVTTPRDVRTVIPSEPGKGFILVYDGGFSGGRLMATAHFRDGRTQEVELPGGGF